jgi:hypothetical protein
VEILHEGVSPAGKPFVKITVTGGPGGQLSPDDCREFGLAFLEAAEAAEHDAAVFAWLRGKLEMDVAGAATVIGELRSYRGQVRDRWADDDHQELGG